ncbi:MAG: LptF/LptG family permease, partial [Thermoguttaceae bacterium]
FSQRNCRPMNMLTRYVLLELAKIFLVVVTSLTMLLIVVLVVRVPDVQRLPISQIARLIPFLLPDVLRMTVPVSLLLATTSVYGRMAGSNEVMATKALGISPIKLLWPAFVMAFLISLVAVWLNDLAVSWGRAGAQRVLVEAVEEIAYSMLRSQRSYSSKNFAIHVQRVEDRRLINPRVSIPARGDTPGVKITAESAQLRSDLDEGVLKIISHNTKVKIGDRRSAEVPGRYELEIPLSDASRAKKGSSASSTALWEIPSRLATQEETLERLDHEMAAEAAFQMLSGDFRGLTDSDAWGQFSRDRQRELNLLNRLTLEPHRRWSAGFSCLCFAFVGAPMAICRRKGEWLTNFFLCFLPILIVYYPLLAYGIDGAKNGTIPAQAVWSGNVLLVCWGAWLLRKVIRY